MPLSAPEYWLEWAKNYFRCQFTYVGELIHKETWSSASFGWAEGLQTINPPIYRLTTAVSDIDQTNINRDIRDGNWLSRVKVKIQSSQVHYGDWWLLPHTAGVFLTNLPKQNQVCFSCISISLLIVTSSSSNVCEDLNVNKVFVVTYVSNGQLRSSS